MLKDDLWHMASAAICMAILVYAAFAGAYSGASRASPQTDGVQAQGPTQNSVKPKYNSKADDGAPDTLVLPRENKIIPAPCNPECSAHGDQAEENGTEFWPPFLGYRLKVSDTAIILFTALLFVATVALWFATRVQTHKSLGMVS
jgi:hypothetical protein